MPDPTLTVSIGTDHAGFPLKAPIIALLQSRGHTVLDCGCDSDASCDYPDFIRPAAEAIASGRADCGIVLGGSGNGEAIVANKVPGVRCGLCWDLWSARMTKEHNNANCIAIGARPVGEALALEIVATWLDAQFEGGRHARRVAKIEAPVKP
jgi:ribose 5-phosphate isomerase B